MKKLFVTLLVVSFIIVWTSLYAFWAYAKGIAIGMGGGIIASALNPYLVITVYAASVPLCILAIAFTAKVLLRHFRRATLS